MRYVAIRAAVLAVAAAWAGQALAWGDTGHRLVGVLGVEALPSALPAFLRTPQAAADIGELAREPDRWRGAGKVHDGSRDPGHFVDGDDQGRVLGGPSLGALPPTRLEYDTQLRAAGQDSWKAGWLPYSIIDGWQQLTKDLALWRAAAAGERLATIPAHKSWLTADRLRRERLVINDLGVWAHYVGDATQPMHMSVHYNGWGDFLNPNGYTQAHVHVPLEGPYVQKTVSAQSVRGRMAPYRDCHCVIEARVAEYLVNSARYVEPIYALEKAGGFKPGDARGPAFMADRLAEAASQLRDLVVDAWNASDQMGVGYPAIPAADVEAGKAGDGYDLLYGTD